MDAKISRQEGAPFGETLSDKFALFECKFAPMEQSDVVKRGLGFSWGKNGVIAFELDGKLIHPDPVLNADNPRYVMAGTPSDVDSVVHGGGGIVRKMLDTKMGRIVAAKRADLSRNTILEAQRLAQFAHPNIVTIYDIAVTNPKNIGRREIYFISEWLEGKTLKTWNKQNHTLQEVGRVAGQIAEGLNHINSCGYVYGDLKPLNIMFDHLGIVKIVDVGISEKLDAERRASGIGLQTYNYAPPEQWKGELSVRTDVYSLGAVVFEILSGIHGMDFKFALDDFIKDNNQLIPLKPEYSKQTGKFPGSWEKLSAIMHKALQLSPEDRFESVQELNNEFQNVLKIAASP